MKHYHFYVGKETGHITWTVKLETGSIFNLAHLLHGDLSYKDALDHANEFNHKWESGHCAFEDLDIDGYYLSQLIKPCEHMFRDLGTFDSPHYKVYHYIFHIAPIEWHIMHYFDLIDVDTNKPFKWYPNSNSIYIQLHDVIAEDRKVYVKQLTYELMEQFILTRSSIDFEFSPLNLTLRFL